MKRLLDLSVAGLGLLLLSPLLVVIAVAVKLDSHGPVFFKHSRVGREFKLINVYKFRTMAWPPHGPEITTSTDSRVTRLGHVLRKTKIDELPQLFNVLVGQMSMVGPRPEVPRYVSMFRADYGEILTVRPGITGPAALKYRDESALLESKTDPEAFYLSNILPDKISMDKAYVRDQSFLYDIELLTKTVAHVTLTTAKGN